MADSCADVLASADPYKPSFAQRQENCVYAPTDIGAVLGYYEHSSVMACMLFLDLLMGKWEVGKLEIRTPNLSQPFERKNIGDERIVPGLQQKNGSGDQKLKASQETT